MTDPTALPSERSPEVVALITLRFRLSHMLRKMTPAAGVCCDSPLYQNAIWMRHALREVAAQLPVRRCQACGKIAADAPEWGYEADDACTEHWSAWA